jgi:phosphate transport system substrate-binding protein
MKLNKRIVSVFLLVGILLIGGCSSSNKSDSTNDKNGEEQTNVDNNNGQVSNENDNGDETDLSGTITITGSTSVEKILNDMIDEFMAYNPEVTINYTGTGSSSGISDTLSKANDIGASSRELKDSEKTADLKEVVFAHDGIAVVVNPANKVKDISVTDLAKIYSGEITNWKQLGGDDANIIVVSREDASGTRSAFEELIKLADAGGLVETATVVEGNGTIQSSVAGNPNAIGYVSFAYIDTSVSSLTVDGVEPTAENAKAGTYSLSRPFLLVYMESDVSAEVKAFLNFAVSPEGQEFVAEHGGIKID